MAAPLLQSCQKQRSFEESGDFQEDILDPRIQTELEKLNSAAEDINRLELALDESRANFRQTLTESTQQLNAMAKKLGSCIEKARPYYEARLHLKEAQIETQNAALRFDRACSQLMAAKEMVFLAEQGYFKKGQPFDPAWQEMLNHATTRVNEAETERLESEEEHQQTASLFNEAEQLVKVLQKDLKRTIAKSRPYFELKAKFNQHMEDCKKYVTQLEQGVASAKKSYADALFRLEKISDEIHQLRAEAKLRQEMGDRGMGVGAETPSPPPEESNKNYGTLATNELVLVVKDVPQKGATANDVDRRQSLDTTISDDDRTLCAEPVQPTMTEVNPERGLSDNARQHVENSPEHAGKMAVFEEESVNTGVDLAATVNSMDIASRTDINITIDDHENAAVKSNQLVNDSTSDSSNKSASPLTASISNIDSNKDEPKSESANRNENLPAADEVVSFTEPLVEEKCTPLNEDKVVTSKQWMKSPVIYTNKGMDPAALTGIRKSTVLNKVRNFERTSGNEKATDVKGITPVGVEKIAHSVAGVMKNPETVPEKNNEKVSERGGTTPQDNVCIALTLTSPDSEKSLAFSAAMSSPESENNSERERTMYTNAEVMERVQRTKDVAQRRFLRLRRASHDNLLDEFSDTDSESVASVSMLDDEQVESLMQETSEYVDFLSKHEVTNSPLVRRMSLPGKLSHLANYVNPRPVSLAVISVDTNKVIKTRHNIGEANSNSVEAHTTGEIVSSPAEGQENSNTKAEGNTCVIRSGIAES